MRNLSRLEKRTCLSSTCYRPSMVSNAFPDQSFSPCHHREIICSYIQTPTAPAVPRRYSFYAECPSLPSTVGFSRTPFSFQLLRSNCFEPVRAKLRVTSLRASSDFESIRPDDARPDEWEEGMVRTNVWRKRALLPFPGCARMRRTFMSTK